VQSCAQKDADPELVIKLLCQQYDDVMPPATEPAPKDSISSEKLATRLSKSYTDIVLPTIGKRTRYQ
jgi:hypothetical protein